MTRHKLLEVAFYIGTIVVSVLVGMAIVLCWQPENVSSLKITEYPQKTGLPATLILETESGYLGDALALSSKMDLEICQINRRSHTLVVDNVFPAEHQVLMKMDGMKHVIPAPMKPSAPIERDLNTKRLWRKYAAQ